MRTRTRFFLGAILCLLLVMIPLGVSLRAAAQGAAEPTAVAAPTQTQMASPHFALHWNVAASGGGRISSANFELSSTIGQPVIGNFDSAHFEHRAGFWQEIISRIFLPLITKS